MRKLTIGVVLASAALGFLISPAMAADPPLAAPVPSAADQAFLTSLAVPVAPTPVAKRPAFGAKALCTATASCGSGTVYCEGYNSTASCTAVDRNCGAGQQGRVTCDGVTTLCPTPCPPPSCDLDCDLERTLCQSECSPCPFTFSCSLSTCTVTCRCRWSICPV